MQSDELDEDVELNELFIDSTGLMLFEPEYDSSSSSNDCNEY